MKLAIMQPYFFPYLGYFQLLNHVDEFVLYDNIQFSKKGWIHRNRILVNGEPAYISVPLKKDSDYLDVVERRLSDDYGREKSKLLRRLEQNYRKAPHFAEVYPLLQACIDFESDNLYLFVRHAIESVMRYLSIETRLHRSSDIDIDHRLKGQEKVVAICQELGASEYINPIGGTSLYSGDEFQKHGISLGFLRSETRPYDQGASDFVPDLSIIDVLMWNSQREVAALLQDFSLS